MYEDVREGLQKIRDGIPTLRAFKRAAMLGHVLPVGDSLDTFLPTYLYIAVVSLLDDALKAFIKANYPSGKPDGFHNRICFLSAKGRNRLKNPTRLVTISSDRNAYAHEPGKYASWNDLETLLIAVEEELRYLGVL